MNLDQARELLPWYAEGSLEADEAQQVADQIAQHEDLARELKELRLVHDAVADVGEEEPQFRSEMIQEALAQIDEMEAEKTRPMSWNQRAENIAREYLERLQWGMTPSFARVAVVGQFALVAVLSAALVLNQPQEQVSTTLSGPATQQDERAKINLSFAAQTTEQQVRALLNELNAEIVAGPSSLGIYTIALNGEQVELEAAIAQLQQSTLIQYSAAAID